MTIFQRLPKWSLFLTRARLNIDLLGLNGLVLLVNLPFLLDGRFFPIHDTMQFFTYFYFFYNSWFTHHQMPQWFPYVTYGLPANFFQFRNIGPIHYVLMLFGSLFHIRDALLLLKIAILLEQMLFVTGLYKLCRRLFAHRAAVLATTLTGAASTVWYSGINYNFRVYYLFPLALYYLVLFIQTRRAKYFWWGSLIALVNSLGLIVYMTSLRLFVFSLLILGLLVQYRGAWRTVFSRRRGALGAMVLFGMTAVGFLLYLKFSLVETMIVAPGRNPDGSNTLETFLTHGRTLKLSTLLRAAFIPVPLHLPIGASYDVTFYTGLFSVIFFGWALLTCWRNPFYRALIGSTLVLLAVAMGTPLARLAYAFPLMAYYRHIGLIVGWLKVFIVLCAGFGLDHFLSLPLWKRLPQERASHVGTFLLLAIGLNLLWFQARVISQRPRVAAQDIDDLRSVKVHPLAYQPTRYLKPRTPRQQQAYRLVMLSKPTAKYTTAFNFIQLDACDPVFRVEVSTPGTIRLVSIPGLPRGIVGCLTPKLRLVPQAVFMPNPDDAAKARYLIKNFFQTVVLGTPAPEPGQAIPKHLIPLRPSAIHVTNFHPNGLSLNVQNPYPEGAWLVYADAYHPAWRAWVDNKPTPVLRADLAFKALFVPFGHHTVRFGFAPSRLLASHALALFGLLAGLVLCGWMIRQHFLK